MINLELIKEYINQKYPDRIIVDEVISYETRLMRFPKRDSKVNEHLILNGNGLVNLSPTDYSNGEYDIIEMIKPTWIGSKKIKTKVTESRNPCGEILLITPSDPCDINGEWKHFNKVNNHRFNKSSLLKWIRDKKIEQILK